MPMDGNRTHLYQSASDFYTLQGSGVMKLTPSAAIEVCHKAMAHNLVVMRVEGGIWHNPGFEARYDCIWDGIDPPTTVDEAEANNMRAAHFIKEESAVHDAFIITMGTAG